MRNIKALSILVTLSLLFTIILQPVFASGYAGAGAGPSSGAGNGGYGGGSGGKGGSGGSGEIGTGDNGTGEDGSNEEGEGGNSSDHKGGVDRGSGQGGSGNGKGSGGKNDSKGEDAGTITLTVTVEGIEQEVNVILTRDGVDTVIKTVGHIATFKSEASGDCLLTGEAIPGFTIPSQELSLTGSVKEVEATLKYETTTASVTSVELSNENLYLFKTETAEIHANINPPNANNQIVDWSSDNTSVATVAGNGLNAVVTAKEHGTANIMVTTEEGNYTAKCIVTVPEIVSIHQIAAVTALMGEVVSLPKTVAIDVDNSAAEAVMNVPVKWEGASDYYYTVPKDNPEDKYILKGNVVGTNLTAEFTINVDKTATANPVLGVALDVSTLSMFTGESYTFTANLDTKDDLKATNPNLIWTSTDESVAKVENGVVTGVTPGTAIITVKTVDGGHTDSCLVSVALAVEPAAIFACDKNGDVAEGFTNKEDVYINVTNLGITSNTRYFVKVEEQSNNPLLGNGDIYIDDEKLETGDQNLIIIGEGTNKKVIFNLYAVTHFELSDSYSATYFLSMSTDDRYPLDDEKTLKTNFKIGTAVPTIPTSDVKVNLDIYGGPRAENPAGIVFLLCRELDIPVEEVSWKDYYAVDSAELPDTYYTDTPGNSGKRYPTVEEFLANFTDEVKMKGVTGADGKVIWNPPSETLKLGGYILLQVTPPGYVDNLNSYNTAAEDGSLLKEVHLVRDEGIVRNVVNLYSGTESGSESPNNPPTTPDSDSSEEDVNINDRSTSSSSEGDDAIISVSSIDSSLLTFDLFNQLIDSSNVKGHWSKNDMAKLANKGIFKKQDTESILNVDSFINESEVLDLVKSASKNVSFDPSQIDFKDIKNMTRQKVAVILMMAFGFSKVDGEALSFKDAASIDENAKGYVAAAYKLGIIKGYPDNTFRPNNVITRAEFYAMLSRCLGD